MNHSIKCVIIILLNTQMFHAFAAENVSQIPSILKALEPKESSTLCEIKQLRIQGKLIQAKSTAEQYLKLYPKDGDVLFLLGLIYQDQQNVKKAQELFTTALQQTPSYTDVRLALIRLKIKQGAFGEARTLISKGLIITPQQADLVQLKAELQAKEVAQKSLNTPLNVRVPKPDSLAVLNQLRALRKSGKLKEGLQIAQDYLQKIPKDYDVKLQLGLMYAQQKNYSAAKTQLEEVLQHTPEYLDARVGLIHIAMNEKNQQEAKRLLAKGLKLEPKNAQLLSLKKNLTSLMVAENVAKQKAAEERLRQALFKSAQNLLLAEKYRDAKIIVSELLKQQPMNSDYIILLSNIYLEQHNDYYALSIICEALRAQPNNIQLLIKRGQIDTLVRAHSIAAQQFFKVLQRDPKNEGAKRGLADIENLSPHFFYGVNDIGLSTDNAYVDDLQAVWNYSSLSYLRELDIGRIGGKINYASRLGFEGRQYEIDFSPRFNRNFYAELITAYSKVPELFPNTLYSGEGFLAIPKTPFEVSAGAKWAKIERSFLRTYTGSLSFYPEGWWINFRPFYYFPKDSKSQSILYTARVRKYFGSIDHFVGVGAGVGRSPDLADLLTVNFLVIKNRFVNVNYTFGIFNYRVLVDLSAGYQRWQYPSDLVRRLYDGSIGFCYRF